MRSFPNWHDAVLLAVSFGVIACGPGSPSGNATATIDTLPSGMVRIVNRKPAGFGAGSGWDLGKATRFGDADGTPGELILPIMVRTDDWGRVYIVDRQPAAIKVFGPTGNFIRTIGRPGGGPGEYRAAFPAVRSGHLIVHDPQQQRTSAFDTSGTFVTSWPSSCCIHGPIAVDSAGQIHIPTAHIPSQPDEPPNVLFTRFRLDGTLIDTVGFSGRRIARWEFEVSRNGRRGMTASPVPFAAQQYHTAHPTGGFVFGWSAEARLARTRTASDTLWITEWPASARPLPDSLRRAETDRFLGMVTSLFGASRANAVVSLDDVPTVAPLFSTITTDPHGYTWAQRFVLPGDSTTVFDIFDDDGTWLGTVTLPVVMAAGAPTHVSRDAIFAIIEDEDGRPTVLRYPITR